MAPAHPEVPATQIRSVAGARLANGIELVSEGSIFLEQDRLTRALYLMIAGYEEILKVRCCREIFPPQDWVELWRGFRSHRSKVSGTSNGSTVTRGAAHHGAGRLGPKREDGVGRGHLSMMTL